MKFFDSYGNAVKESSLIIIEATYNAQNLINGQEAVVTWDIKHGMFLWSLTKSKWFQEQDFYGVHKFKLIQ